jgi:hypothetical protein
MAFPNVVIGGAPKSGTSSLFAWLGDHPRVCAARPKETFFLMDPNIDDPGYAGDPKRDPFFGEEVVPPIDADLLNRRYQASFAHRRAGEDTLLERCSGYLYQRRALDVLSRHQPQPHMIFVLRDPAERIRSYQRFAANNLGEIPADMSLKAFLDIARSQINLQEVYPDSPRKTDYFLYNIVRHSEYHKYIRVWKQVFDDSKFTIIIFEDLIRDPLSVISRICERINVDPTFYSDYSFNKQLESYTVVHRRLHALALRLVPQVSQQNHPGLMARAYADLIGALKRSPMKSLYLRVMTKAASRSVSIADDAVLTDLAREFAPHNCELSRLTGLDLSCWRTHQVADDLGLVSPTADLLKMPTLQ